MSVSVCTCKWPLFRLCSVAGVDQIIIENEQLLTEKYVLLPSAFLYNYVHTGSWYPDHITDNGVPLVCKIIPIHVHRTYCIYSDCVLCKVWYAAKSLVSEIHFDSQLHKLYGIVWLTSTVFLSSRGELSREVDELMIKLRDTEKYVWNSCLSK